MNTKPRPGRTVPGKVISIKVNLPIVAGKASRATTGVLASIEAARLLLSDKPLRRPNRLRPLR